MSARIANERHREVAAFVMRHRGRAAVGVAVEDVAAPLADAGKAELPQNPVDHARIDRGQARHSGDLDLLYPDEFGQALA